MKHEYPVLISPASEEDGGGFVAYVPDLRGCMSDGETVEQAAANVQDAIAEWIEEAREAGLEIPAPHSASRRFNENYRKICEAFLKQDKIIEALEGEIEELRELAQCLLDDTEYSPVRMSPVFTTRVVQVITQ